MPIYKKSQNPRHCWICQKSPTLRQTKKTRIMGLLQKKKGLTSFAHPGIEVRQPPISNQITNLAGGHDADMGISITGYP
ncbi:hypothetical protein ACU8C1_000257 [Escherichia coli]